LSLERDSGEGVVSPNINLFVFIISVLLALRFLNTIAAAPMIKPRKKERKMSPTQSSVAKESLEKDKGEEGEVEVEDEGEEVSRQA